jgi:hypothetical protein
LFRLEDTPVARQRDIPEKFGQREQGLRTEEGSRQHLAAGCFGL